MSDVAASNESQDFDPELAAVLAEQGAVFFDKGEYEAAVDVFSHSYWCHPDPVVAGQIVESLMMQGADMQALFFVDEVMSAHKDNPQFLYHYMCLLQKMGQRLGEGLEICASLQDVDGLPWSTGRRLLFLADFQRRTGDVGAALDGFIISLDVEEGRLGYEGLILSVCSSGSFEEHEAYMNENLLDNDGSVLSPAIRCLLLAKFHKAWFHSLDGGAVDSSQDQLDLSSGYATQAKRHAESANPVKNDELDAARAFLTEIESWSVSVLYNSEKGPDSPNWGSEPPYDDWGDGDSPQFD